MSYEEEKQDRKIERLEAEIERLRAENAGLSKAVIDTQEERDLAQAEFRTYHKAWEEQAARIQEPRAELASANVELMAAGETVRAKEARIAELEDALVEVRARSFSVWIEEPRVARDVARQQLQAEGKIGPDASKPRSWQITDERTAALRHLVAICPYENCSATGIIKAMLEEAGQ